MKVISYAGPMGSVSFTPQQVALLRRNQPQLPPGDERDGIPDFTDEQVQMIIEDEGNAQRAVLARTYH